MGCMVAVSFSVCAILVTCDAVSPSLFRWVVRLGEICGMHGRCEFLGLCRSDYLRRGFTVAVWADCAFGEVCGMCYVVKK